MHLMGWAVLLSTGLVLASAITTGEKKPPELSTLKLVADRRHEKRGIEESELSLDHEFGGTDFEHEPQAQHEASESEDHGEIKSITIHKTIRVPVPHPIPVPVEKRVPVHIPFKVPVPVEKPYPVHVIKPYPVLVDKPVPYTVEKNVPYPVKVPVKIPVFHHISVPVHKPVPYTVHKPVPYPVKVPYIVEKKVPIIIKSHKGFDGLGHYDFNDHGFGHF